MNVDLFDVLLVLFVLGCLGAIRVLKTSGRLDRILAEFRRGAR